MSKDQQSATSKKYADWDEWNPRVYLETYFNNLGPDSFEAWKFLIRELKALNKPKQKIIDFGAGPTLFAAIPIAPYAKELHMVEYQQRNLDEIQKWLDLNPNAYNWDNCIGEVLKLEGATPSQVNIEKRKLDLRKISKLMTCDASRKPPIPSNEKYPIVVSTYCADSATSSKTVWQTYMENMFTLLETNGVMLLTALRRCSYYRVGNYSFPCANIDEFDLENLLIKNGFSKSNFKIEVCQADRSSEGFEGLIFAKIENRKP